VAEATAEPLESVMAPREPPRQSLREKRTGPANSKQSNPYRRGEHTSPGSQYFNLHLTPKSRRYDIATGYGKSDVKDLSIKLKQNY